MHVLATGHRVPFDVLLTPTLNLQDDAEIKKKYEQHCKRIIELEAASLTSQQRVRVVESCNRN
eukprot:SAG31_NODE_771_length_12216_cov_5.603862_9_plen_63_part_00